VSDVKFPSKLVGGIPVLAAPEEIDITNAAGLRIALLDSAKQGHGTFVVDLSRTVFCDTSGLHVLVLAHKRALAEGGEVRLVVPGGDVLRIFAITGIDRVIPQFGSLDEAIAGRPAASAD
jgi:anti-sigma B factor antagonist